MHRLLYLLLIPLLWFLFKGYDKNIKNNILVASAAKADKSLKTSARLKSHSNGLLNYARQNGYNTNYAFLADMRLASGSNRFFVYDLKKDTVVKTGLVTHGYGPNNRNISFSNIPGSNCTSLGKYKIGKPYNGRFGLAYKLYGLDRSNSNAFNRFVVLHSHDCVPYTEVAPQSICMSQGCPTVSPAFLTELKTYLDKAEKPLLLYIFY